MNRRLVALTIPLAFLVLPLMLVIPVYGCPPLAEGCAFMRVDRCRRVHGPAVLYGDEMEVILQIDDDGTIYKRSWNVARHYTGDMFQVFICYNSDGRLVVVIYGSRAIALGPGALFYGRLI